MNRVAHLFAAAVPSLLLAQSDPVDFRNDSKQQEVGPKAVVINPDNLSTRPVQVFAPPAITVLARQTGHGGGLIAYLLNDGAANSDALPAAISAWGDLPLGASGNAVFGGYSLATLEAKTGVAVGQEITARNNSGVTPDGNLPPNLAIGTNTAASIGENLTCGGTGNCSIGLNITSEGGSNSVFETGEYIGKFGNYGLFVDANRDATAIVAKAGTNGISLRLQNSGIYNPEAPVLVYEDAHDRTRFVLKQDGSIETAGRIVAAKPVILPSYTVATLPPCDGSLKGGFAYVNDASAPTYNGALHGGGKVGVPVICNGAVWSSH